MDAAFRKLHPAIDAEFDVIFNAIWEQICRLQKRDAHYGGDFLPADKTLPIPIDRLARERLVKLQDEAEMNDARIVETLRLVLEDQLSVWHAQQLFKSTIPSSKATEILAACALKNAWGTFDKLLKVSGELWHRLIDRECGLRESTIEPQASKLDKD